MERPDSFSPEAQIAFVAKKMLSGEIPIVRGCRELMNLFGMLDKKDYDLFAPIIAVESETEDLPVDDARSLWSPTALASRQKEIDAYIDQVQGTVLEVCETLVQKFH